MAQRDQVVEPGESKVLALKQHYGNRRAELLTAMFDLPFHAAVEAADQVNKGLNSDVSRQAQQQVFMSEAQALARGKRDVIKAEYLESEVEEAAAISEAVREAMDVLTPDNVTTAEIMQASTMSEEQLLSALEVSLAAGNDDASLLFIKTAMERDLDGVVAYGIEQKKEWAAAYTDIQLAQDSEDLDEVALESKFESLAQPLPEKGKLLEIGLNDVNIVGRLKG